MIVTVISLLIAIGSCIFIGYRYSETLAELNFKIDSFQNALGTLPDEVNVDIKNLVENYPLRKQLIQYQRGFRENKKTSLPADVIFKIENLASKEFNLRKFATFNNTLIGLGILFTFIGLALGVGYFGVMLILAGTSEQTAAITTGINTLLGGMGAAFFSSVGLARGASSASFCETAS